MKTILSIAVLALGINAFAETHQQKTSHADKKEHARQECLKENPSLQGAELDKCIQDKQSKTKK